MGRFSSRRGLSGGWVPGNEVGGTCVAQVEGAQEAHAVAQPRGQGECATERAVAEKELKLGEVLRPARTPVAQRHGGLVEVGEQRARRREPLGVLLRHLAPASGPWPPRPSRPT